MYWKLGIDERNFLIIIFDPEPRILKEPVIELDCLTAGPAQKPWYNSTVEVPEDVGYDLFYQSLR